MRRAIRIPQVSFGRRAVGSSAAVLPPPSVEQIEATLSAQGAAAISLATMSAEEVIKSPVFRSQMENVELRRLRRFHHYEQQKETAKEQPSQEGVFMKPDFGVVIKSAQLREPGMVYPGSRKGTLPEDDPDYFDNWFYQNLSPEARHQLFQHAEPRTSLLEPAPEELTRITEESFIFRDTGDAVTADAEAEQPEILDLDSERYAHDPAWGPNIPDLPEVLPGEEEAAFSTAYNWAFLRNVAAMERVVPRLEALLAGDFELPESGAAQPDYYPTLFAYFNTLPREMRENSGVVSALRALERYGHHLSLAQKQEMLNRACRYSLPLSETDRLTAEAVDKARKYHPTMADQINIENPEPETSINSRRRILLAQVKEEWPLPPRNIDPGLLQDDMPMTPLEYYINDDGYWDDYIAEKEKRRGTVPLPITRPSFKH